MVDVYSLGFVTEGEKTVALGGEVLLIGGASGVPDKQCIHDAPPRVGPTGPRAAAGSGIGAMPDRISQRPTLLLPLGQAGVPVGVDPRVSAVDARHSGGSLSVWTRSCPMD